MVDIYYVAIVSGFFNNAFGTVFTCGFNSSDRLLSHLSGRWKMPAAMITVISADAASEYSRFLFSFMDRPRDLLWRDYFASWVAFAVALTHSALVSCLQISEEPGLNPR